MGQTDPRRSACSAAPPVRHMQTAGFAARTNLLSFERGASRPTGGQQSSTPAGMRGPPQSQVVPYVMQSAQSTVQKWRQWHIKWRLSVAMQQAVPPDEHTAMGEVHPQGQLALRGALANQPALSCQRREGSASIHQQPDGCGCEPHSTRSADESDDASFVRRRRGTVCGMLHRPQYACPCTVRTPMCLRTLLAEDAAMPHLPKRRCYVGSYSSIVSSSACASRHGLRLLPLPSARHWRRRGQSETVCGVRL